MSKSKKKLRNKSKRKLLNIKFKKEFNEILNTRYDKLYLAIKDMYYERKFICKSYTDIDMITDDSYIIAAFEKHGIDITKIYEQDKNADYHILVKFDSSIGSLLKWCGKPGDSGFVIFFGSNSELRNIVKRHIIKGLIYLENELVSLIYNDMSILNKHLQEIQAIEWYLEECAFVVDCLLSCYMNKTTIDSLPYNIVENIKEISNKTINLNKNMGELLKLHAQEKVNLTQFSDKPV